MGAKQFLIEALRLSEEERAALAGELIQSLEGEVHADAEAAWSAEFAHGSIESMRYGRRFHRRRRVVACMRPPVAEPLR